MSTSSSNTNIYGGGKTLTKQEEITTKDLLEVRDVLDNADVPTDNRQLKIVCPHCGEIIDIVGEANAN